MFFRGAESIKEPKVLDKEPFQSARKFNPCAFFVSKETDSSFEQRHDINLTKSGQAAESLKIAGLRWDCELSEILNSKLVNIMMNKQTN